MGVLIEGRWLTCDRVRTLTGKEIELDIEADYKVRSPNFCRRICI
jgi:hypothetical protein